MQRLGKYSKCLKGFLLIWSTTFGWFLTFFSFFYESRLAWRWPITPFFFLRWVQITSSSLHAGQLTHQRSQNILASLTSPWPWQWPGTSLMTSQCFLSTYSPSPNPPPLLITERRKEANSILDGAGVRHTRLKTQLQPYITFLSGQRTRQREGPAEIIWSGHNLGSSSCTEEPGLVFSDGGLEARLAKKRASEK